MNGQTLRRWDKKPWRQTKFQGKLLLQTPVDLVLFMELIERIEPGLIVEFGVLQGGFARWLRMMTARLGFETLVGGVDLVVPEDFYSGYGNGRVDSIARDSLDPMTADAVDFWIGEFAVFRPAIIILDDDHEPEHVAAELASYLPLLKPGDWIVVCDTVPVRGLEGAVRRFVDASDRIEIVDVDRFGLSNHRGGWLRVVEGAKF